jgi:transposase-like protein
MIPGQIRENLEQYLSKLMNVETAPFLGQVRYEHGWGEVGHCNASCVLSIASKRIVGVQVEVPRDRKVEFRSKVIFRSAGDKDLPTAFKCLENSQEAFLNSFWYPEEKRMSPRTTCIIERLS